jgi:hypothetical protein
MANPTPAYAMVTMQGAINLVAWTTATRPSAPAAGATGYNTTLGQTETWSGTAWVAGGAPTGVAGGDLAGAYPNPSLATTGVAAGSYTNANITVDAKGRLAAAANGSAGSSGNYTAPYTGAVTRTITSKLSDAVSVLDFSGIDQTGATDSTAGFQEAINTGRTVYIPKPTGFYRLNGAVTCATPGQIIYGDGKGASNIRIDTAFNMSALGVFVVTAVLPSTQFRDFEIDFVQPDTSNRASLTQYPPAFYAQNMGRGVYRGLKITKAWTGLDLRGNCGGTVILDCEMSAFNNHIIMDGFLDTCMIANTRLENDAFTANQSLIYGQPGTIGLNLGRGDGIFISNCSLQCGTQVFMYDSTVGAGGDTLASFTNCAFDGGTGFNVSSARLLVSSSYFSTRTTSGIKMTGGEVTVTGCHFYTGGGALPAGEAFVGVQLPSGVQSDFNMSGCILDNPIGDMNFLFAGASGSGLANVNLTGNTFRNAPGIAIATVIDIKPGANATLAGNRLYGIGSGGSGIGISIEADGFHNITGNSLVGLTLLLPTTHTQLVSANNN